MKQSLSIIALCLITHSAYAWEKCDISRELEKTVNLENIAALRVDAGAGKLEIRGSDRADIAISARLCAEDEETLAKMQVASKAESDTMRLETVFPKQGWSDNERMRIDLVLEVPDSLPLTVNDSSGAALVKNVASLDVTDSSGELVIKDIAGDLSVVDSSGELKIENVTGSAEVTDSSGALIVRDIEGNFVINADSSGGIDIRRVGKDVLIRRDSSGSIEVSDVGGNFSVLADGSGGIGYDNVAGKVTLPE